MAALRLGVGSSSFSFFGQVLFGVRLNSEALKLPRQLITEDGEVIQIANDIRIGKGLARLR